MHRWEDSSLICLIFLLVWDLFWLATRGGHFYPHVIKSEAIFMRKLVVFFQNICWVFFKFILQLRYITLKKSRGRNREGKLKVTPTMNPSHLSREELWRLRLKSQFQMPINTFLLLHKKAKPKPYLLFDFLAAAGSSNLSLLFKYFFFAFLPSWSIIT